MASPDYDLRFFPLVRVHVPPFVDVESLDPFYSEWERIGRELGEHVAIVDFRDFDPVFAATPIRRRAAELARRGRPIYDRTLRAEARVVDTTLTRAMLTAFDWLVGVPWPVANVRTPALAEEFVCAEARRLGIPIPDEARADH